MPTIMTHAAVGAAAAYMFRAPSKTALRLWALSMLCAVLPDADVIGYRFLYVPAGHLFGHRGFFHSLLFSAATSVVVAALFFRWQSLSREWRRGVLFFFLVSASHGLLDACTDGGSGIGLFLPFSNHRFFFPWTPIEVSPLGIKAFLGSRGLSVLISEALWVWGPLGGGVLLAGLIRRRGKPVFRTAAGSRSDVAAVRPAPHRRQ